MTIPAHSGRGMQRCPKRRGLLVFNKLNLPPDSSFEIAILGRNDSWHRYINEGRTKQLFLYVFNVDSLKKFDGSYSMDDLINQRKYLSCKQYSEEQLDKIKWKIVF